MATKISTKEKLIFLYDYNIKYLENIYLQKKILETFRLTREI